MGQLWEVVGAAVKVAFAPLQTLLDATLMDTLGSTLGFTVMVIAFEFAMKLTLSRTGTGVVALAGKCTSKFICGPVLLGEK